jgi:anti-sigma B factor antagonist
MLETTKIGDVIVARMTEGNRLNAMISEQVRDQLVDFFARPGIKLVFDLNGITYIDSSGFGVFLSAMKAAANNYGQFKVCNVNRDVMELFRLLQLHHVFEIYDQLDPCIQSFRT